MPRKIHIAPPFLISLSGPQFIVFISSFVVLGMATTVIEDTLNVVLAWLCVAIFMASEYVFLRLTNALRRSFFKHTFGYIADRFRYPARYTGRYDPFSEK